MKISSKSDFLQITAKTMHFSLFSRKVIWYNPFDKLEFDGESPLTIRYELRRKNHTIGLARPVAAFRSAYGIRQT